MQIKKIAVSFMIDCDYNSTTVNETLQMKIFQFFFFPIIHLSDIKMAKFSSAYPEKKKKKKKKKKI
jgi:hypothetical protein